jgi:hypothetical protein
MLRDPARFAQGSATAISRPWRVCGLAIALILHLCLCLACRSGPPPPAGAQEAETLWLAWVPAQREAARPDPAQAVAPASARAARTSRPVSKAPGAGSLAGGRASSLPAGALEAAPEGEPAPGSFATLPATAGANPRFDPDAAIRLARKLANEPDTGRAGITVAQLDLVRAAEGKEKRNKLSEAHRPYCKDGLPGGLLFPLFLLFEKKNSGCRW